MADIDTVIDQHVKTTKMSTYELVRRLNSHLGPTLVATLAGVKDRRLPHKWAVQGGPIPRDEAYRRLQAAHRIWQTLSDADDDFIARAWFIGANPRLNEESPVMSLRAGNIPEVMAAATAFADGMDE